MKDLLVIIISLLVAGNAYAQSDLAIGQWKSYLPHNNAKHLAQNDDKIIIGTDFSIYTIDKSDNSVEYLSKIDGLTETGIQKLSYDPYNDQLIIAYDNSIIDFVQGSTVTPVFDIQTNTNFLNRKINDIFVQNEEWVYFATGFGLVQFSLIDFEFGFTLDAGQEINSISGNEDYLLINGSDGLYLLDFKNENFPNALSSWQQLEGGIAGLDIQTNQLIGDNIYAATDREVLISPITEDTFSLLTTFADDESIRFLKTHEDGWMVGLRRGSSASRLIFYDQQNSPVNEINTCTNRINDALVTEDGSIYFSDDWVRLRYIDAEGNCNKERFDGPAYADATDISIRSEKVYVASGGITESFSDEFGRQGIYILEEGVWNNLDQDSNPFYKDNGVIQFYQIEAHPSDPKYYIGSFWSGILSYDEETDEQVLYNASNTNGALGPPIGDNPDRVRISGMSYDEDDNLWLSVFGAEKPIAVLTDEGIWHGFDVGSNNKTTELIRDDLGYVWSVIAGNTGGVIVYDPNGTISDPTDDPPARFISSSNSEIPSNLVNAIAMDLDGSVWIGTAAGAVVFECGSDVLESSCDGFKPQVQQPDGNIGYLLATEDVQAIAVDGANRKWFGTRNGIFVMSPSGEEQIMKFDIENSPLFDNNIKAMSYSASSGEMFVASNKGIQSYRTQTTTGKNRHDTQVYAFPNPVRPEYDGVIAIKGLVRDAEVIITDIDGQLVYKTQAQGGQAIWDGRHLDGQAVAGGVYLVFSSSTDTFRDPDAYVTKIMMIR